MDYFQGVVRDFLSSDRAMFVNEQALLYLDEENHRINGKWAKGRHWYCDAMAVNLRERAVYLCEGTYASGLTMLAKRLNAWAKHWPELRAAICRDSGVDPSWSVQPWVFVPENLHVQVDRKLAKIGNIGTEPGQMPWPKVTYLEDVAPWNYSAVSGDPLQFDRAAQQVVPADAASRDG